MSKATRRIADDLARRRERRTGRRPSLSALVEEGVRRLAEADKIKLVYVDQDDQRR